MGEENIGRSSTAKHFIKVRHDLGAMQLRATIKDDWVALVLQYIDAHSFVAALALHTSTNLIEISRYISDHKLCLLWCQPSPANVPLTFGNHAPPVFGNDVPPTFGRHVPVLMR